MRSRQPFWIALGFFLPLVSLLIGFVMWGNHIEHRIDHIVIERRQPYAAAKGGDALQTPPQAHQQPGPVEGQEGGHGGGQETSKPPLETPSNAESSPPAEGHESAPEEEPKEEERILGPECVINALGIKICVQA